MCGGFVSVVATMGRHGTCKTPQGQGDFVRHSVVVPLTRVPAAFLSNNLIVISHALYRVGAPSPRTEISRTASAVRSLSATHEATK